MNIKRGIGQYKAHWLAQLNEIEQLINEGILPKSFGEEVSQLCNSISNFRFKVPLIGKFSVGKSTLLNTWLGQDIQKVDLAPCTGMATEFHYAEAGQEKIVICWIDDPKTGSIRREELPLSAYPACMGRWQSSPPPSDTPLFIEIHLSQSRSLALHPDLVLVDTPGLGSTNGLHERAIQEYIGEAVSFILCVTRSSQIGKDELDFIDRQRSLGQDFSLLVCQEALSNPSERQSLRESLANQAKLDSGVPVYGCSAIEGDLSGFSDVLSRIETKKEDLFRNRYMGSVDRLLKLAHQLIHQQLKSDPTVEELQKQKKGIDQSLVGLEENFSKEQNSLLQDSRGRITRNILGDVGSYLRGRHQAYVQMLLSGQDIGSILTADARNACELAIQNHLIPRCEEACKKLESAIGLAKFDGPPLDGNVRGKIEADSGVGSAVVGAGIATIITVIVSKIPKIGIFLAPIIAKLIEFVLSRRSKESEAEGKVHEIIELVVGRLQNELPESVGSYANQVLDRIGHDLKKRLDIYNENLVQIEEQMKVNAESKQKMRHRAEAVLAKISELINSNT